MKLLTQYQSDYSGGLNNTDAPSEIADNEASLLRNWDITYEGKLKRRDGTTLVGASLGSNAITGIGGFVRDSGQDIVTTESTNLYYLNGVNWSKIADGLTNTTGLTFWFENVQAKGKIYFANEDNVLRSWDRASTTLNTCITAAAASVPHGNGMKWAKNYMFHFNNVNVSGTKAAHTIYWSALGDPTTYDTTNDKADVPGDGRLITAVDLGDVMVIFKERAIQYLTGYGATSWRISTTTSNYAGLDQQIGCPSLHGAVNYENSVWFVDNHGQIRRVVQTDFDKFRTELVSTKIQTTLSGINKAQLSKVFAWANNNKIYFAYPNGSDTYNSLLCVYDVIAARREALAGRKAEAWTTYTGWTPSVMTSYASSSTPDLYWGDATTGKVYKHTGYDDNGVAIDARFDSKDYHHGKPEQYKQYKLGYIRGTAGTGVTESVNVYASISGSPFTIVQTLDLVTTGNTLGPTGNFYLGPTGTAVLGGGTDTEEEWFYGSNINPLGKRIKISLRHAVTAQQPTVGVFSNHFRPRELR